MTEVTARAGDVLRVLLYLLLLFTVVPIVELTILFRLAERFSWPATISLVLVTGVIGAGLARREGLKTLRRIQDEMSAGRVPAASMVDGALILLAGALLVTPGVLTDVCGFLLLIPLVRRGLRRRLADALSRRVVIMHPSSHGPTTADGGAAPGGETPGEEEARPIIDVAAIGRDADGDSG